MENKTPYKLSYWSVTFSFNWQVEKLFPWVSCYKVISPAIINLTCFSFWKYFYSMNKKVIVQRVCVCSEQKAAGWRYTDWTQTAHVNDDKKLNMILRIMLYIISLKSKDLFVSSWDLSFTSDCWNWTVCSSTRRKADVFNVLSGW